MSSSESKLVSNAKEAAALGIISAGIGFLAKKALGKNVTSDPSASLMNAVEWVGVMLGVIYARDARAVQFIVTWITMNCGNLLLNQRLDG